MGTRIPAFLALVFITACSNDSDRSGSEAASARPASADIVLTNAFVYTADANRRIAEAVAIRGNAIVHVGTNEEALQYATASTTLHDLGGRMLMPGLHDMHIHATGVVEPDMCDFRGEARSLEELVPFLKDCIERFQVAEGEWLAVLQWPFSQGNQPSEKLRTLRAALDAASDRHPIIMLGDDGHHAAVNSLALAQARDRQGNIVGLNRDTLHTTFADYAEMVAVDASGEPSGGVNETARLLIRPDLDDVMMGLQQAPEDIMPAVAERLAAAGITSIQDPLTTPRLAKLYAWLADSGHMSFRLRTAFFHRAEDSHKPEGLAQVSQHVAQFRQLREQLQGRPLIQANGVKLFADAVLEGNPFATPPTLPVAAILGEFKQPLFAVDPVTGSIAISGYVDLDNRACVQVRENPANYRSQASIEAFAASHGYQPGQCIRSSGVLEHAEAFIHDYVRQMTEAGFHVHIHALSDKAVRVATDAFAAVKQTADKDGLTQSITHVQLAHPDDVRRLGELGVYVAFTYLWILPDPEYDVMVIPFIDEVKGMTDLYNPAHYYMQNVYPVKSVLDAGGVLTFGSDAPVGTRDPVPFPSMQAALTREADGVIMNPDQRVTIHDILAAYTINGARLMGLADKLGSIEVGKTADLIVLDRNIVELAEQGQAGSIGDTRVDMTVFDGKVVYERQ